MSQPRVLVLGGTGFVGRNFVKYLIDNNLASKVRVVDKSMPAMCFFSEAHTAAFANPAVEFKQANLTSDAGVTKAFEDADGKYNLVFNFAGETKFGMNDEVYANSTIGLTMKCANAAVAQGVDRFVQLSTAQVYDSDKKPTKENGKLKPWTGLARASLEAETQLQSIAGLNFVILRAATIYGPGDTMGVFPRVICGAVYKRLNEKYKCLWSEDLRINTVHVSDVAKACWHVAVNTTEHGPFNLADKGNTDQQKVNASIEAIYGIKTGYLGTMLSSLAKANPAAAKGAVNEKHMEPWGEILKEANILNSPLTPYIDEELLSSNHLSVDGSAIEATGFQYDVPELTTERVREVIDIYIQQGLFPASAL